MIVFLLLIVVLLIGLTTAAAMGGIAGFMAEPTSSHAFPGVPSALSAEDVGALHFDQALRGYRMDQVDEALEALAARLRELESDKAPLPAHGSPQPEPPASRGTPHAQADE